MLFVPEPHRCPGCGLPHERCVCAAIPRVACRLPILMVRHVSERHKASNTGGLTSVVLGCPLIDHGVPGPPTDLGPRLGEGARLLSTGGQTDFEEPPSTLVVLDGTWAQARRMRQRIPPLPSTPVLTLPAAPDRHRARRPLVAGGMSTMEAVAEALDRFGESEPALALRELHALLVDRWLTLRRGKGWAG